MRAGEVGVGVVLKRLKVLARAASVQRKLGEHPPALDPALGDALGTRLLAAARQGDWRAIGDLMAGVEHPDDHTFYVRLVAYNPGVERWVDDWIAAEPQATLPLLVKGARAVDWAWEARGSGRARTVLREAFAVFFQRLELAEACLAEVAEREPDSATPWAFMVVLGRARQLGLDETRRRFAEACRRYPWHRESHYQMLQQLCRKWSGSHELMHEFAARTVTAMPPGSPLGGLVPTAHLEQWLDTDGEVGMDHLRSRPARDAVRAAADRSIHHPDFTRRPGWPFAPNAFAMFYSLIEDHRAAIAAFDIAGDHVVDWPWKYLNGEPPETYAAMRARAHLLH